MEEKPKYKKPRCPHDKIKAICKLCGGTSICPHKIRKADWIINPTEKTVQIVELYY